MEGRWESKAVTACYFAGAAVLALLVVSLIRPDPQPVSVASPPATPTSSTVAAPPTTTPSPSAIPHFAVIGDSYTGGSSAGGFPPSGWPFLVMDQLRAAGTPAMADISGRGGSGYVQRGTDGTIFVDEIPNVVSPDDKVIVFFGSMNDAMESREQITAAVNTAFDTAMNIAPQAKLLVIAPAWPNPSPPPGVLMIRDVLTEATAARGGVFVDPLTEGWLWDGPDTIGFDGIHPTNVGHQQMAARIAPFIGQLIAPAA